MPPQQISLALPAMYSVEVPGTAEPARGWGPIRRSSRVEGPGLGLRHPGAKKTAMTSFENFTFSRIAHGKAPFLGHRPVQADGTVGDYVWETYEEVGQRVEKFGSGLVTLGLCPEREDAELRNRGLLGFYAKNRPEWVIGEQGCYSQAIIPVPGYDTLGVESIAYVINQTEMTTMFCSAEVIHNLFDCKASCPSLQNIIQMEPVNDETRAKGDAVGLKIFSMAEVEEAGAKNMQPLKPPSPKDIMTFCYTSGTTGDPKGALITHEGIVSGVSSITDYIPASVEEVHLSYLPLPHIFERMVQVSIVRSGARIGFYQGDTLKIIEDLQALRPTVFPSVPRLLNRIYDKLQAQIKEAGGLKEKLFNMAYASKLEGLKRGTFEHAIYDRILFSKIKEKVGLDRVKQIITGSAPIGGHVLDFLRIVFCCPVMEGYGMTEGSGACTLSLPGDLTSGTVGPPLNVNEIRLQDVPDMGYFRTDTVHGEGAAAMACVGRGEICYRGSNVFNGYYKMPDKTADAIDSEGWMHSGDIGLWTPDGKLKIIDRLKNIFKLQQGEYVAPEKIENINAQCQFIAQNMVYGDSLQCELVSIITVDPDAVTGWAQKNGKAGDLAQWCKDPDLIKAVLGDLKKIGAASKLQGFEIVKAVLLEPEPWAPGGAILTPTFKLQRAKAAKVYEAQIKDLYAQIHAAPVSKL